MRNILILLMTFGSLVTASAQEKNKNAKYSIEVSGNCGQCKKRIEKAALSVNGVKSAVWNEEDGKLSLILNEEKSSLLDVEKAIAKVGHDTPDVKSTDADYEKLHSCCKYDRETGH
ncbi:heavy-metal-associated domain-containing protein [Flavobacterium silvaticum]|uniref:Cation transporter n=1 Tax=Flavobacterium silvaticum TaxID=1852020 RepID=A0A972FS96_9FLAO|nr:cation transporter [Flavobacterium silvaticum]NMH27563.1 cation transporter [Flavobacterium silvaticum]